MTIRENHVKFHVVDEYFPIQQDVMLGKNYFKKQQAILSYFYTALVIGEDPMRPIPFVKEDENKEKQENTSVSYVVTSQENCSSHKPNKIILTARSKQRVTLPLQDSSLQNGYLPMVETEYSKIYLVEFINDGNICTVMAINNSYEDENLEINPCEIFPYAKYGHEFLTSEESDTEIIPITEPAQRVIRTMELLRLDN